jgi:hypothetical protein
MWTVTLRVRVLRCARRMVEVPGSAALPSAPSSEHCPPCHAWPSASGRRIVVGPWEGRLIGCWILRGPARWCDSAWLSGSHTGRHQGEYPWTTLWQPGARRCCAEQGCRAHHRRTTARPCHSWPYVAGRRIAVSLREAARPAGGFCEEGALGAAGGRDIGSRDTTVHPTDSVDRKMSALGGK